MDGRKDGRKKHQCLSVDYNYLWRKHPEISTICGCLNSGAVVIWFQNKYATWVRDSLKLWFSELVSGWKRPIKSCHCFLLKKKKKWSHNIGLRGSVHSDFKIFQARRLPPFSSDYFIIQLILDIRKFFQLLFPKFPFFLNIIPLFTLFHYASFLYLGFYSLQVLEDGCHLILFIHPLARRTQKSY